MGLINDIPTCEVLCNRIEREAEESISRLVGLRDESFEPRL